MNGVLFLTLAHLRRHAGRSALLVACTALALFLPVAGTLLVAGYERDLDARARATPLVLGAKGNRFDLVLDALYFRGSKLESVPWAAVEDLRQQGTGTVIPLHLGGTARQRPVVGTTPEYFALRGLRPARGTLPLLLGDACVGAAVARDLGLAPGGTLFSDPRRLYDITTPPALELHVSGVLPATGTADDGAVFVDVKTAWVLDGLAHGHADPGRIVDESLVLGAAKDGAGNRSVVLSEALIEHQRITADNLDQFHFHGDPATLPVSAVLFVPESVKAATMTKAKVNVDGRYQMLVPAEVVRELIAFVFALKRLFDALSLLLGAVTAALTTLVLLLSARLRRREMRTLHRLGCSPGTVALLHGSELAILLALGAGLAALLVGITLVAVPDLAGWLGAAR